MLTVPLPGEPTPEGGTSLIEAAPALPKWVWSLVAPPSGFDGLCAHSPERPFILEAAAGADAGLVSACLPNARSLGADDLRLAVTEMILTVVRTLRTLGFPHAVRMWSFIPGIHDAMGGKLDRYRVFNVGRFEAFSDWFGGAAEFACTLPAASAVGHWGDNLYIHALGSQTPGRAIDNPRQLAAFRYSRTYGPRPPCFARATVAQLPGGPRLLVAGTASILGERSVHPDSLSTQFDETLENLRSLARSAERDNRYDLGGVETARVYHPRASDRRWLVERLPAELPAGAHIEYTHADICRPELLVEIELTIAPAIS